MKAIKKVLYPTDFSDLSAATLAHAAFICERYGAELHVVHATQPAESGRANANVAVPLEKRDWSSPFKEYVASLNPDKLRVKSLVPAEIEFESVPDMVLEYADQNAIDLIVLGTHGRRGLGRLILGSTAEEVVRLAKCSVLTVGAEARKLLGGGVRKILVPIDFSAPSMKALDAAKDLAGKLGATLDALHVIEPVAVPVPYGIAFPSVTTPEVYENAKNALEKSVEDIGELRVVTHVAHGIPENVIKSYAHENGADLIVMASHGLTGFDRFVNGSVSQEVLRQASCPVYTVKR